MKAMDRIATELAAVQDGPSAQAAAPRVQADVNQMESLVRRMVKLPAMTQSEGEEYDRLHLDDLRNVAGRIKPHLQRIRRDPQLLSPLNTALQEFDATMSSWMASDMRIADESPSSGAPPPPPPPTDPPPPPPPQ